MYSSPGYSLMRLDVILIVHDIPTVANDVIEVNVFPPPPPPIKYFPPKKNIKGALT